MYMEIKKYTLEYQTTGNNQAIEIREVKEKELGPFAKEKGKHTQSYCKKKKKKWQWEKFISLNRNCLLI